MRFKLFFSLIIIPFLMNQIQAAEEVAKVAKARGQVHIKHQADVDFSSLKAGQSVFDGDVIKVGGVGFCIIVFLDDKSILKIRESTQFQFIETANTRTINIDFGKVLADVKKDKRKDFRIETPVSVASVKGTEFWMISDPLLGDKVIGIEGLVELQNLISGEVANIGADQTGSSTPNGTLTVNTTNPDDIPEDIEEEEEIHELRIQLQDADGQEKDLIIKFQ